MKDGDDGYERILPVIEEIFLSELNLGVTYVFIAQSSSVTDGVEIGVEFYTRNFGSRTNGLHFPAGVNVDKVAASCCSPPDSMTILSPDGTMFANYRH